MGRVFSPPQGVTFPLALVKSDFIIIFFPGLRERLSGLSSVLFGSQLPSFPALGLRERALAAFIIIQYSIGPPHIPPAMIISLDSRAGMGCFAFRIKDYEIRNGNVSLDNQLLGESLSQSCRKVRVELVGQGAAVPVSHL